MGYSTIKTTSKKVSSYTVATIEITSKKVRENKVDFSTIEITSKKIRGNHVMYPRNIHVELTSIRRGAPVG